MPVDCGLFEPKAIPSKPTEYRPRDANHWLLHGEALALFEAQNKAEVVAEITGGW